MSNKRELNKELNLDFADFLAQLKAGDAALWTQLVGRLRRVTVPWLAQRIGNLPNHALVSLDEFVLEIFANSLATYFPLFQKGTFNKYQELQSLMFRVAELKMKEAFTQLNREKAIYHPATSAEFEVAIQPPLTNEEKEQKERITNIQTKLKQLPEKDQKLLLRYYEGEKMVAIAEELGIAESSIRKRKQRALDRLKKLVLQTFKTLF